MSIQDHCEEDNHSPYESLAEDLNPDTNLKNLIANWQDYKDKLIIFLGAGASYGACNLQGHSFPSAWGLRDEICAWAGFPNPHTLPLEIAAALAEAKKGRGGLENFIAVRFEAKKALWQHVILPLLNPKAVLTTNYDGLIEQGWPIAGSPKRLTLTYDPKTINPSHIPLYKPHGTVGHPFTPVESGGLVITQFDYFRILTRRREMLENYMSNFKDHCVIFIGYSFNDMDIAAYLFDQRQRDSRINWYAVFPRDDDDVRGLYRDQYKIRQIGRTFHRFLADLDDAVNFIPNDWKFNKIPQLVNQGIIAG